MYARQWDFWVIRQFYFQFFKVLLNSWDSPAVKVDAYSTGPRIILSKVRQDEDCFIGERFVLLAIQCYAQFRPSLAVKHSLRILGSSWSISIQILCFGCYPSKQRFKTAKIFALKNTKNNQYYISSVQFSHSIVSDSLAPHESQHARPPCPSPAPGVHSNSPPLS